MVLPITASKSLWRDGDANLSQLSPRTSAGLWVGCPGHSRSEAGGGWQTPAEPIRLTRHL